MRIAVISDLHGNLLALDAVLADIQDRTADKVVNLGDLVSGGLAPAATADRLMELGQITVRGNHERQVLRNPYEQMSMSDRLAHDQLTEAHRVWFASLPLTAEIAAGVLAFHGSPYNDVVYLLETVDPDGARPATEQEITARLGEYATWPLLLCGHTHLQRQVRLGTGTLIVNPGSAGWPAYDDDEPYPHVMESGSPHARYAIVDNASGRWEAELLAVQYDWEAAARLAESNGRPDVAVQLRTGRAR
ncbi:metallophosphoesterase family protein [Actinoplanes siamensis]|uniref:DNA methylase n=1 Tax=Actinoplanes siamensis TaxID=1223317 RepID=A0A919TK69_9ACTN|nr:metallophosphoesterase family protein [Actinoplanes siamensis]GIF05048.1 DNA methylase [Actinoplanes siamensis]